MNQSRHPEARPLSEKPGDCMDCGRYDSSLIDGVVCKTCDSKGKGDAGSGREDRKG